MMPSACGKVILGGEHSVVHRGRALAFPLVDLRLTAVPSESTEGLWVNGKRYEDHEWARIQELLKILGCPANKLPRGLVIKSQIPIGGGLGSSSALCAVLAKTYNPGLEGIALAEKTMEGERLFHGSPSGIDPYTVALEKPIVFNPRNKAYKELQFDRFREQNLCFVIADSGEVHRTQDVIASVNSLRDSTPLIWDDLMDALATNAESMLNALETDPRRHLGRLMRDTHFRLSQLGVSTAKLDELVEKLLSHGALGAKLTGAGCGGCVLALFNKDLAADLGPEYQIISF